MPDRSNPVALSVLGNLSLGKDEAAEKSRISGMVEQGLSWDRERGGWVDRQRLLTRLRYGIRREKTFPWKNASNLAIPFIDHAIRKYKPTLLRLVVEPDPVVEFVGADAAAVEAERLAETVYNWLFKTEMDCLTEIAYLIDCRCHRGFGFLQVGWEYLTEWETRTVPVREFFPQGLPEGQDPGAIIKFLADQYGIYADDARNQDTLQKAYQGIAAGEEFVKLTYRKVIQDRPALYFRDPIQVIAPPRTTDVGNAESIIIQHVYSLRKLRQLAADGFFSKAAVDEITRFLRVQAEVRDGRNSQTDELDVGLSRSMYLERQLENERDQIFGVENEDNILIWEYMHWYDHNGDGLDERVVSYIHPRTRTKLRASPYSAPYHEWSLVKFDFEKVSRRWNSSRGISALLGDLQLEINAQHNARIDGMTIRNAPAYQIPVLAAFKTRNFRVTPGTVIETPSGATLQPLTQERGAFPEMVNEENLLRSIGENYIGIFDAAITSPQSNVRSRTATEISAVVQYTAATATFDAVLFQVDMAKVHNMIWALYMDNGPAEIKLKVAGLDPKSPEAQFMTVKKTDINRKFKLHPTGTVANTNRALELQNARETVAMYINDQSGFINPHELRKWHISLLAQPRIARRLVNSPEQAQELVTLQQAAASLESAGGPGEPSGEEIMATLRGGTPVPDAEREQQEIGRSAQSGILSQGELNGRY
jgi:hypothetical protein